MLTTNLLPKQLQQLSFIAVMMIALALLNGCSESATAEAPTTTEQEEANTTARIVSLNGTITELLYALDYGDRIVGVDVTSTYPAEKTGALPKLGHVSKLNTEALLEMRPDLIFVDAEDADKEALQQLRDAGIKIHAITSSPTLNNAADMARQLAEHLAIPAEKLNTLNEQLAKDQKRLQAVLAQNEATGKKPKVLFIYARGAGRMLVAGKATEAASMIEIAGGENAITTFDNFEAMTPESLVAAAPDVILMFTSGLASLDGVEGLSQVPGIQQTPAYQNENVVAMDGQYLLGFGPRSGSAATELAEKLLLTIQ